MNLHRRTGIRVAAAFLAALGLAAAILAVFGSGERGTVLALRATARLSFLLFWPAYAGSALAALSGWEAAGCHGRDWGLAFAAAHLVHVGLILWLYQGLGEAPIRGGVLVFDGLGLAAVGVLVALSAGRVRRWLPVPAWRRLRDLALHMVALVFLADFVLAPLRFGAPHPFQVLPFTALTLLAGLLRLAAALLPRLGVRRA